MARASWSSLTVPEEVCERLRAAVPELRPSKIIEDLILSALDDPTISDRMLKKILQERAEGHQQFLEHDRKRTRLYRELNREAVRKRGREYMRRQRVERGGEINARRRVTSAKFREKRKVWLHEIKSVPCLDCGHTFDPVCMDFDHRPGETKLFHIGRESANLGRPLEEIKKEIAKCDIICACCHRIRTYRGRDHGELVKQAQQAKRLKNV